jgi:hypothetical protein
VHFHELIDPAEPTALLTQVQDRPGLRRSDPGQLGKQLETGLVDVDRKQLHRDDFFFRRDDRSATVAFRSLVPSDPGQGSQHDPARDEEQDVPLFARHRRRSKDGSRFGPSGYRCRIPLP